MKKVFKLFFVLFLFIASLFVVGCGKDKDKDKDKDKGNDPVKVELVVEFTDPAKTTLKVGETAQLGYTVTSESTATGAYVSSDASVASVSDAGLVTANAKGSATITITVTDTEGNKKEKSYNFTVEAITYTLTLDLDGGALAEGSTTQVLEEGTQVTLPTPTKEGFNFIGWKLDKNYVTKVTLNKDLTVKAEWEKQIVYHTVTYNLDGGTLSSTTAQVADGSDYVLKTPTKDGFAFLGYTLVQDSTEYTRKLKNVTADTQVFAHWIEVYQVTYNLDGGAYDVGLPKSKFAVDP